MATVNRTDGNTSFPHLGLDRRHVISKRIDLSATNSVASDTLQCINIPAKTFVEQVLVEVITAEGGTLTATVGDGTDPNGWDASVDLNAAVGTVTSGLNGTDAYMANPGKYYSAADTIDLVMSANAGDTAVFAIHVICTDLSETPIAS